MGASMKNKNRKSKKEMKENSNLFRKSLKGIKNFILLMSAILLLLILIGGTWFYFSYGKTILNLQGKAKKIAVSANIDSFKETQTSLVYASDGSLISVLKAEKDVYYLTYDSIPKTAIQAMLATEDRKFYDHGGFDLAANIRASILLIKNKGEIHQGASTITQQLARTVFLTNEVTWERKITEIFLASELEKKYSKNQIMEFYLNNIYFANGHYGIQAAANGYFSKSATELSLSQIAFLCTIPNNPTIYDPITNFDNVMERRDKVLVQMYEEGYITKEKYRKALKEKITLKLNNTERKNYVESYTYYCAIRALMEQEGFVFRNVFQDDADKEEYQERYYEAYYRIQKTLYTKGYRIYTSIDLEKQAMLQESLDKNLEKFTEVTEEGIYTLQGSGVCIDNDTGRVTAIVGGRSQEFDGYTLNRAYQSFRQPGSAIKPLIIYTPLFEQGLYPDSIVVDEKFEGSPKNADGTYAGEMTVRRAVEVSKNTVAWKLFLELSPRKGLSYLLDMNFSRIVETDYVPAASIGGLTYGVSTLEMASAYATLANDGYYRDPTCIVRIMDAKGNEIIGNEIKEKKIYQKNAVHIMTDVLKGVMTNGTGRKQQINGITSAGKTGTTGNQKDGWFCGYTKYYTTAVWIGYDMPKRMEGLAGNSYPGYVFQEFMNQIHIGLPDRDFEMYEDDSFKTEQIWKPDEESSYEDQSEDTGAAKEEPLNQEKDTKGEDTKEEDTQEEDASEDDTKDEDTLLDEEHYEEGSLPIGEEDLEDELLSDRENSDEDTMEDEIIPEDTDSGEENISEDDHLSDEELNE